MPSEKHSETQQTCWYDPLNTNLPYKRFHSGAGLQPGPDVYSKIALEVTLLQAIFIVGCGWEPTFGPAMLVYDNIFRTAGDSAV